MIIRVLNYAQASEQEKKALLHLFKNVSTDTDFMATGEVENIDILNTILQNKNLVHFFGYEDNTPVAYCQVIHKPESVNFNSGAKINAISVLPERRGQGLGRELLVEVITTLQKDVNIKNIYLDVVKDNVIAVNLYKEVGFEKVGELKNIFKKDDTLMDIEIYSLQVN